MNWWPTVLVLALIALAGWWEWREADLGGGCK